MLKELIKIANQLDAKGYYNLANELNVILKQAAKINWPFSMGKKELSYYLIQDDSWQIVPQTGYADTKEDGIRMWAHHEGAYALVESAKSQTERREKIIKMPGKVEKCPWCDKEGKVQNIPGGLKDCSHCGGTRIK